MLQPAAETVPLAVCIMLGGFSVSTCLLLFAGPAGRRFLMACGLACVLGAVLFLLFGALRVLGVLAVVVWLRRTLRSARSARRPTDDVAPAAIDQTGIVLPVRFRP